jgi:hypothetical protein
MVSWAALAPGGADTNLFCPGRLSYPSTNRSIPLKTPRFYSSISAVPVRSLLWTVVNHSSFLLASVRFNYILCIKNTLVFLCVLCGKNAFIFAFSAAHSFAAAATTTRQPSPSQPLHLCHFSASTRHSRRHKLHIQRQPPSLPRRTSAVKRTAQRILNNQVSIKLGAYNGGDLQI